MSTTAKYTLPDGQSAYMPEAQASAVWAWWRGTLPHALARGEGVAIEPWGEDAWCVRTVYARLGEAVCVVLHADGDSEWISEPGAPDVEPDPSVPPWRGGPACGVSGCYEVARVHRSEFRGGRLATVRACARHATEDERAGLERAKRAARDAGLLAQGEA